MNLRQNLPPTFVLLASLAFVSAPLSAFAQGAEQSETTDFPEDGAPLPRADMPEGSVEPEYSNTPPTEDAKPPADDEPETKAAADKPKPQGRLVQEGLKMPHLTTAQNDYSGKSAEGLTIRFDGYIRVLFELIEDDERDFIGDNNGFRLASGRFGLYAAWKQQLFGYLNIETAVSDVTSTNDPNAELTIGLRDGFIGYQGIKQAEFWLGRFQMPYDVGTLESTRERTFIDRPIETRGVLRLQGNELRGMSQGRQIGLMIHSHRLGITDRGFDIGYAAAVSNGRTDELVFNDNNKLAYFGRLSLHYGPWVTLNGGVFFDQRTVGELPNLFDEDVLGVEGSLQARWGGMSIEGQLLWQNIARTTVGQEDITALGWHAQIAYERWGFELAYRYGWYDPQANDQVATDIPDQVDEHTLGLSYFPSGLPLRFSVNGTLGQEELEVKNNRLTFMAQFKF